MAEYIEKNKVINLIEHNDKVCHYADERYENVVYATSQTICGVVADMPAADVQPVVTTEDLATVTEQFICKNCGIRIEDFSRIVLEEDDDGYVDELHYEYRFKFCPECGAKIVDGGAEKGVKKE